MLVPPVSQSSLSGILSVISYIGLKWQPSDLPLETSLYVNRASVFQGGCKPTSRYRATEDGRVKWVLSACPSPTPRHLDRPSTGSATPPATESTSVCGGLHAAPWEAGERPQVGPGPSLGSRTHQGPFNKREARAAFQKGRFGIKITLDSRCIFLLSLVAAPRFMNRLLTSRQLP